jgi:hypothetical protein
MKKTAIFSCIISAFLFTACSDKQFFKPTDVTGSIKFDKNLPAKIISVNSQGATLQNGEFITKDGVVNTKLPDGYDLLSKNGNIICAADKFGNVIVLENGKELLKNKFDTMVVAASATKDMLAVITSDNSAILLNVNTKAVEFKQKNDEATAVNAKIAAPYFLNELVIYPTLDGKLFIYDTKEKKIAKDLVVSSDKYFNNIIFLDIIEDRLIAATSHKVFSISPKYINSFDADVSDIIFIKNGVYIFTTDGRIILTDSDLRKAGEKKFPFARFIGVIYGKYIYAVESQGYLIATDINLKTSNIFKFSDSFFSRIPYFGDSSSEAFEDHLFTSKEAIYYGDKQFTLAK